MILSTAFSIILGLNITPYASIETDWHPAAASAITALGPAEPISLIAGDELGLALFSARPTAAPPALIARFAAANTAPPSWTVVPGAGSVHLAATH